MSKLSILITALLGIPSFAIDASKWGIVNHTKKMVVNKTTNWKQHLNGKTNGKRECTRRVKQMARVANG